METSCEPLSETELLITENDIGEALIGNVPWTFSHPQPVVLAASDGVYEVLCNAVVVYGRYVSVMHTHRGGEVAVDENNLDTMRQPLVRLSIL